MFYVFYVYLCSSPGFSRLRLNSSSTAVGRVDLAGARLCLHRGCPPMYVPPKAKKNRCSDGRAGEKRNA